MIKQTFYNLPQTKRQRILDAIIDEFNSVSTNHISINRIISDANISRGSFYQYFDDKSDLYDIIADAIAEKMKTRFVTDLANNKGDIFKTFETLYDNQSVNFNSETRKKYQSFIPLRNSSENSIMDKIYIKILSYTDLIISNIDTANFRNKDRKYVTGVLSLLFSTFRELSVFNLMQRSSVKESREKFMYMLEIIKYGCLNSTH